MIDPLGIQSRPLTTPSAAPAKSAKPSAAGSFTDMLRSNLERVSESQQVADRTVEDLVSGATNNISEVLTAARKAQVAFSLLMEIRNKLTDAYTEIKQLRV